MALEIDIEEDLDWIFEEVGSTLTKRVVTESLDTYGREKGAATNVDSSITGLIMPINMLNPKLQTVGWISPQNYAGYFKLSDAVNVHNLIIDGSNTYKVIAKNSSGFPGVSQTKGMSVCELIKQD